MKPLANKVLSFASMLLSMNVLLLGQPASIPYRIEPFQLHSGICSGKGIKTGHLIAFRATVQKQGIPWIRLMFGDAALSNNSCIIIKSLKDGGLQRLNSSSLTQWNNTSAFFNGDAVEIQLDVAAQDSGVFFEVNKIMVGGYNDLQGVTSICGSTDDRTPSTNRAVGRIVPGGCTGWIVSSGVHVTAGHCARTDSQVLEFNVPSSLKDGTIQHPPPQDQYSINQATWNYSNNGVGDDWAVFAVQNNDSTNLQPIQAQQASFAVVQDSSARQLRVTGYGVDGPSPNYGNGGSRNSDNQTPQTHVGPKVGSQGTTLNYEVDTQPGNSGSPVIDDSLGTAVGVHTNGGCTSGGGYNSGTSAYNSSFWNAVHPAQPPCTISGNIVADLYVDGACTVTGDVIVSPGVRITVNPGATLQVNPGLLLTFQAGSYLNVFGTLNATNATFDGSGSSNWGGIIFNSGSNGSLSWCTIKHGSPGVKCNGVLPSITYCTFDLNSMSLWLNNVGTPGTPISGNNFYNQNYSDQGISCYYSSPQIGGGAWFECNSTGIFCVGSSPTISNSTFMNNAVGVCLFNNSSAAIGGYNRLLSNGSGIYADGSNNVTSYCSDVYTMNPGNRAVTATNSAVVIAQGNYWGQYPPNSADFVATNGAIIYYLPGATTPWTGSLPKMSTPTNTASSSTQGSDPPGFSLDQQLLDAAKLLVDGKYDEAIGIYNSELKSATNVGKKKYVLAQLAECYRAAGKKGFIDFLNTEVRPTLSRDDELYATTLELENLFLIPS